jgi:hypothetical protein
MKRSASCELVNVSSRLKVEETVKLFYILPFSEIAKQMKFDSYNTMLRLNKFFNSCFKDMWRFVLENPEMISCTDRVFHDKLIIAIHNSCPNAIDIYTAWRPWNAPTKTEDLSTRVLYGPIPQHIKVCKYPEEWLIKHLDELQVDGAISLDLAMQGYSDTVILLLAFKRMDKQRFSWWIPGDNINVTQVRTLKKYFDLEFAISDPAFASIVYHQPSFELMKLYPSWQSLDLFIEYRDSTNDPYTKQMLLDLGFDTAKILLCPKFYCIPPVWVFEEFLGDDSQHVDPNKLDFLLTPSKISCMGLIYAYDLPTKLCFNFRAIVIRPYFQRLKVWSYVFKKLVISLHRHLRLRVFLCSCDFEYTVEDFEFCGILDQKYLENLHLFQCGHTPPKWFLNYLHEHGFACDEQNRIIKSILI